MFGLPFPELKEPGAKFVTSLDESLNKVLQDQLDMIMRFWNRTSQRSISGHLDSQLFGHTRATDLLKYF